MACFCSGLLRYVSNASNAREEETLLTIQSMLRWYVIRVGYWNHWRSYCDAYFHRVRWDSSLYRINMAYLYLGPIISVRVPDCELLS